MPKASRRELAKLLADQQGSAVSDVEVSRLIHQEKNAEGKALARLYQGIFSRHRTMLSDDSRSASSWRLVDGSWQRSTRSQLALLGLPENSSVDQEADSSTACHPHNGVVFTDAEYSELDLDKKCQPSGYSFSVTETVRLFTASRTMSQLTVLQETMNGIAERQVGKKSARSDGAVSFEDMIFRLMSVSRAVLEHRKRRLIEATSHLPNLRATLVEAIERDPVGVTDYGVSLPALIRQRQLLGSLHDNLSTRDIALDFHQQFTTSARQQLVEMHRKRETADVLIEEGGRVANEARRVADSQRCRLESGISLASRDITTVPYPNSVAAVHRQVESLLDRQLDRYLFSHRDAVYPSVDDLRNQIARMDVVIKGLRRAHFLRQSLQRLKDQVDGYDADASHV